MYSLNLTTVIATHFVGGIIPAYQKIRHKIKWCWWWCLHLYDLEQVSETFGLNFLTCILKLLNFLISEAPCDLSMLCSCALRVQRTLRDLGDLRWEAWGCDLVQGIRLNTKREIYCPLKTWVVAVFAGQ